MRHPRTVQWGGVDAVPAVEKMHKARETFEASFSQHFSSVNAAREDQSVWECETRDAAALRSLAREIAESPRMPRLRRYR